MGGVRIHPDYKVGGAPGSMGQESEQPLNIPENLQPGSTEVLADVFHNLIGNLGATQASTDRAYSSFIAYMDRVIILSGGTLTLIFTVVGGIGSHLVTTNQKAVHTSFVVISCWLLVTTIITGLGYNSVSIRLQHQVSLANSLQIADVQIKLKLLSLPHIADVSNIPPLLTEGTSKAKTKHLQRAVSVLGIASQIALFMAFLFLTLFIQTNIEVMLGSTH